MPIRGAVMGNKFKKGAIRFRLVIVFVFTTGVIFIVNMFMYYNINKSINTIDKVYISNVGLNELLDSLTELHEYVYEYLNTKSSDALENYYRSGQNYRNLIDELKDDITDNYMLIMQKNIKNMSATYLNLLDQAVDAKRGRNIERYKAMFEEAADIYDYISTYITNLNNEQFKYNSNNYELLRMSLSYLEVISTTVLLVVMVFNIILIVIVTRNITGPLMKLAEAANEVAAGNFEVGLVNVNSSDEIEIVTKAFNTMTVSIHQYIKKIKESMELESKLKEKELMMTNHLKDAQLKYLQAQINPHFLFNTLNAGAQLAMMEGADKTCLFIENVADFFRYNIKSFERDSTIRDEISLVDNYIYIINVRFSGRIHFYKEIDEDVLDERVPSMILQPIVENAVNYGIRAVEYEGEIRLKIVQEANTILITISDNGVGMEQAVIDRIMNPKIRNQVEVNVRHNTGDSNGIGLSNVINRLRLYYDMEDVFEIKSPGPYLGTCVTLRIPKKTIS